MKPSFAPLVAVILVLSRAPALRAAPAYGFDFAPSAAVGLDDIARQARRLRQDGSAYRVLNDEFIEKLKATSKKLAPTTVTIGVDLSNRSGGNQGSGVIIRPTGYIVTNAHVIGEARSLDVVLSDKRAFKAKVVGKDMKTDLAVVKIDAGTAPLAYAQWGNSKALAVGEFVIAVGAPFGLAATTTFGFVSAVGRRGLGLNWYEDYIQTQVPINPGNSGGGLFLRTGELVGINNAVFMQDGRSSGVSFAIPAHIALRVSDELIANGHVSRGKLGVELGAQGGGPAGARVVKVEEEGAAARAGIQNGDVIVEIDGVKIKDADQLLLLVADYPKDSVLAVSVLRQGAAAAFSVTLK